MCMDVSPCKDDNNEPLRSFIMRWRTTNSRVLSLVEQNQGDPSIEYSMPPSAWIEGELRVVTLMTSCFFFTLPFYLGFYKKITKIHE